MLRNVYSSKEAVPPERTIDITFIVDRSEEGKIAAANFAEPYTSNKNKLTRGEYGVYRSYIQSIESLIQGYGFKILDSHQSKRSYSYYILFEVPNVSGTDTWKVRFRVSDHDQYSNSDNFGTVKHQTAFLWIVFGRNNIEASFMKSVNFVKDILDHLENGNIDAVIDRYTTYLNDKEWEAASM